MKLSIVIPAYNEATRIGPTLLAAYEYFKELFPDHELLVVDDGSRDNTSGLVRQLQTEQIPTLRLLANGRNMGKGGALQHGMLAAKGDYLLFCDADQSTPFSEMEKFLPALKQNQPVIIGTRKSDGAEVIKHQPWLRETMGKGFTVLSRTMIGVKVSDFTCGFKLFSREAAQAIFSRQRVYDWSFDSEILHIAVKLGYSITVVPVTWINSEDTRVNLVRDTINSFKGLLRIRYYSSAGAYEHPRPAEELVF